MSFNSHLIISSYTSKIIPFRFSFVVGWVKVIGSPTPKTWPKVALLTEASSENRTMSPVFIHPVYQFSRIPSKDNSYDQGPAPPIRGHHIMGWPAPIRTIHLFAGILTRSLRRISRLFNQTRKKFLHLPIWNQNNFSLKSLVGTIPTGRRIFSPGYSSPMRLE